MPAAPHSLDLVIDFVNTLDRDGGSDALDTPEALVRWLVDAKLLDHDAPLPGEKGLREAIRLREALRSLMLANNGAQPGDRPGRELELIARRGELAVRFAEDGSTSLAAGVEGLPGALARLLVPVVLARGDGSWGRVKACRAPDCEWAFYDRSRNRSGVWCEMAVCGNRTKVRAYRARAPRSRR